MCHCNNRDFSASGFLSGFGNNIPLSALEKGWEAINGIPKSTFA
jgi:hypothetical protein